MTLETKIGPFRLRAWGLLANFVANALALFGLAEAVNGANGHPALFTGCLVSFAMLVILSSPAKDEQSARTGSGERE